MSAAADHSETTLTPAERRIATPRVATQSRRPRKAMVAQLAHPGVSIRDDLLSKLNLLSNGLCVADLELLVDLARAVRRRSLVDDETVI